MYLLLKYCTNDVKITVWYWIDKTNSTAIKTAYPSLGGI